MHEQLHYITETFGIKYKINTCWRKLIIADELSWLRTNQIILIFSQAIFAFNKIINFSVILICLVLNFKKMILLKFCILFLFQISKIKPCQIYNEKII